MKTPQISKTPNSRSLNKHQLDKASLNKPYSLIAASLKTLPRIFPW